MFDDASTLDQEFLPGEGTVDPAVEVTCPYCGEPAEILVDTGGGMDQAYVEDCAVCCRPWSVHVRFHDGVPFVEVGTEDGPVL